MSGRRSSRPRSIELPPTPNVDRERSTIRTRCFFGFGVDRTDEFITAPPRSSKDADQRPAPHPADVVVARCTRIPRILLQLGTRDRDRAPLTVEDEYDLQYVVRALLAIDFDDIRPEEWTPSYAGGSTKMDFLLKAEKTVLELKHTRKGLEDRQVGNEHRALQLEPGLRPPCLLRYDPEHRIKNPDGLIRDLPSNPPGGLDVRVVIGPR